MFWKFRISHRLIIKVYDEFFAEGRVTFLVIDDELMVSRLEDDSIGVDLLCTLLTFREPRLFDPLREIYSLDVLSFIMEALVHHDLFPTIKPFKNYVRI